MKITIEQKFEGKTFTSMVDEDGIDVHEVLQECLHCMLARGFHPDSIKDAILTQAEGYDCDKEEKV